MIEINGLTFQYEGSEKPALNDITLNIEDGSFIGVIGPAGAGKTTLAFAICGIVPHSYKGDFYGSVKINGIDTVDSKLTDISRQVGIVFQDVESQIISSVVEDELLFGLESYGVPHDEIESRLSFALEKVGIPQLRNRTIASLSGGQRQKVAIASIVALRPKILVLDEPTGELDPGSSRQIFGLLRSLNQEYGMTVIVIEQKIMLLCEFAERLIVLENGRSAYSGKVRDVLAHSEELVELGVNCPRTALLSKLISQKTGISLPAAADIGEAETQIREIIG